MIWFVLIAAALVAVALLWVLPPLLRRRKTEARIQPSASNLAILRDQVGELERDLASGTLTQQQYQEAREELDRRVLEESRVADGAGVSTPTQARWTAVAVGVAIPLCAALLYLQLGSPDAIGTAAVAAGEGGHSAGNVTPQQVEEMVRRLAARLDKEPDDGRGWVLLAHSYQTLQRYPDAVAAYERALKTIGDDAGVIADYADALAMAQGRSLEGKPLQLVERVLQLDPKQWKALALAGSAAFDRKDFAKAVMYWEKLHAVAEPNSEFARNVASNIEEARQLGGITAPAVAGKGKPVQAKSAPSEAPAAGGAERVSGSVSVSPALAGKVDPSATVFVFARAAEGPRIPLAITRYAAGSLPLKFSLDDSHSMSPEFRLSKFPAVVIGARISKSGSATPQSGDLQGSTQKIKTGSTAVNIVIDQQVP